MAENVESIAFDIINHTRTGNQKQAKTSSYKLFFIVQGEPSILLQIKEIGAVGEGLLLLSELDIIDNEEDGQLISDACYYCLTKAINNYYLPVQFKLDRLVMLFNFEDFLKSSLKKMLDIKVNPLSMLHSPFMINAMLNDILIKMRLVDIDNDFPGINDNPFFKEKRESYNQMISRNAFRRNETKNQLIEEGQDYIQRLYKFIESILINYQ